MRESNNPRMIVTGSSVFATIGSMNIVAKKTRPISLLISEMVSYFLKALMWIIRDGIMVIKIRRLAGNFIHEL